MDSRSYSCPIDELPFDYDNWNDKWFSPVCRGWYQQSVRDFPKGIVSDPYIQAAPDDVIGVTPCMPIMDKSSDNENPRFFGALCLDVSLTDENTFFPGKENIEAKKKA